MSIDVLSDLLGVPIKTIKDWRTKGEGPIAYKIGNHVRYAASDVRAWLEQCREQSPGIAPGYGKCAPGSTSATSARPATPIPEVAAGAGDVEIRPVMDYSAPDA